MFARAGAAGATGAWNDCTKVVARTCHSQRERQGVSSGSPCCCSDGTAALRAASQGVDPPPQRPPVPPPPQGSPSRPGSSVCLHAAGISIIFRRNIYISGLNAARCLVPRAVRRVQRVPGHHGAPGRSGEPGHHDGQVEGTPSQPHPARSCAALARPATQLLTQSRSGPQVAPMFDAPAGMKGFVALRGRGKREHRSIYLPEPE